MLSLLATLADAQPLAIPADPGPRPAPDVLVIEDERPLAVPEPGAPRLGDSRAIREYRSRYLAVRSISDLVHGTTWAGWGYPYRGWGWGWGWPQPWVYRVDSLADTLGPHRLDVPARFGALGDVTGARTLARRIRRHRGATTALTAVGVAGIVTSVAGLIGMDRAVTWDDRRDWSTVSLGGVGLMVGGFVGASIPSGRAARLQYQPEASFDLAELERRVAEHNERLARELGLDPGRAVEIER